MVRKTREEKAITLIALIITIVVLLILAVVAINAVTGDGIIQHATNAKTEYEKAKDEENGILSYYQEYLDAQGDLGPWKQEGSKIYMTNSEDELIELKIGDIVNYKNESNENYLDKNGSTISWKVLGIEDGKILLISTDNVNTYTAIASSMYINGENDLNSICSSYKNETLADIARSINVDDVNKITRYNPETMPNGDEGIGVYGNKITYTATPEKIIYTATKSESGTVTKDGVDLDILNYIEDGTWKKLEGQGSKTFINKAYVYNGNEVMIQTYNDENIASSEEYKLIFKNSSNGDASFWLASRGIFSTSSLSTAGSSNVIFFGLRAVLSGKVNRTGYASSSNTEVNLGVRAVVKLKGDIEFNEVSTENGITTWSIEK